jgi:tRNA (cytidine/uridine-2'-O-)-methyltransferase
VELALYQPDIAQNTGAMLRLCACLGVRLHVILPTGFTLSRATLRRTGLDYVAHADWLEHDSYAEFTRWREESGRRLVLLTTAASQSLYDAEFRAGDLLMLGRESAGVPAAVAAGADLRLRIPMRPHMRSLNVAIAGGIAIAEALRQTGGFDARP